MHAIKYVNLQPLGIVILVLYSSLFILLSFLGYVAVTMKKKKTEKKQESENLRNLDVCDAR